MKNMKRAYVKPSMENEAFIPSKYVAVCTGATYDAWCNQSGYIFNDYNGNGYIDQEDTYIYKNTACNEHYHSDEKPTFNALAFRKHQVNIEYGFLGWIKNVTVKRSEKGEGIPGFVYKTEHFSTKFRTDPHYVS